MSERPFSLTKQSGTFPVPNTVVDTLLPSLKDGEVRLLLAVLRQTWGWIDPQTGQPKARDWMTSARLRQITGRASEAVSGAIDGLVQRGLIAVEDASGKVLVTAAERRRSAGALHFRPGPKLDAASLVMPPEKTGMNVEKRGIKIKKPGMETARLQGEIEKVFSVSAPSFSVSEIRKSKTTNNITNNNTSFRKNDKALSFPKSLEIGAFDVPNSPPLSNTLKSCALNMPPRKSYEMPDVPLTAKQQASREAIKVQIRERLDNIRPPTHRR